MGKRHWAAGRQRGFGWTELLVLLIVAGALWHFFGPAKSVTPLPSFGQGVTEESLKEIAATVREGDVVMYSTSTCVYCHQAKAWLQGYGFAFKECNMTVDKTCESEYMSYRANGTPFLIVRGHQMHNGFDSDEFLAALEK